MMRLAQLAVGIVLGMVVSSPALAEIDASDPGFALPQEQQLEQPREGNALLDVPADEAPLRADRKPALPFHFRPAHPSDELQRLPDTIPSSNGFSGPSSRLDLYPAS